MWVVILALCTLTLWLDEARTRPLFIPEAAFSTPAKYEITKAQILEVSREMDAARDTAETILDVAGEAGLEESECAPGIIESYPEATAEGEGTIVTMTPGWNRERQQVATLVCIAVDEGARGDLPPHIAIEVPQGTMRVGRTTWCTKSDPAMVLHVGRKVAFRGARDRHNDGLVVGPIILK